MKKKIPSKDRLIVGLLASTMKEATKLVKLLKKDVSMFEVNLPLYTVLGPDVIKMIHHEGGKVFLDLKYHDIPSTAARAVGMATKLKVEMLTVHASGGCDMLTQSVEAACDAAGSKSAKPKILAATVLTSMDSMGDIGIQFEVREQVVRLAKMSQQCGLDGVIASPLEIKPIRTVCKNNFIIATSGVRPLGTAAQDQRRIASPIMAIAAGADYLIIGRPIAQSKHPVEVVQGILKEISG
ncbi:MAG: orotidine-5'-phosphate decarboxylase [Deltaproteobacteria bacterium CG07_land_8_20_14_0_80_38_7]|nr:MAG: orotidine-5'-phosphate decarboxylase [Deltaproteobacteria bacterium CG07_land_8_20_14_0_80_38_7]